MFGNRRLERFEARQEATLEHIGHITAALIVREPGTALSANAYDGLRKQVSIAARDRRQHLARLVELMEAIDNGATTETLRRKCEQWCQEVGLEAVTDLDRAEADWFRIVEGDGPEVEVLTPAWADTEVGHLVQRGTARRSRPEPEPVPEPVPAEAEPLAEAETTAPEAETTPGVDEAAGAEAPADVQTPAEETETADVETADETEPDAETETADVETAGESESADETETAGEAS